MSAVRAEAGGYSKAPVVLCDVYEHTNGKQYHAVKRHSPTWAAVRGDRYVPVFGDSEVIALFPVNPKTGRAWQAARYFKPADVKLIGTIEI